MLLRDLRLAALAGSPAAFGVTHARERELDGGQWRARLAAAAWFVAEAAGEPVGLVRGARPPDGPPGRRYLHSMWVHPDHRGTRIGAELIAAVRAWAAADGADELALWVIEGNAPAAGLYAREGFVPTGRREPVAGRPGVWQEQWVLDVRPPADRPCAGPRGGGPRRGGAP